MSRPVGPIYLGDGLSATITKERRPSHILGNIREIVEQRQRFQPSYTHERLIELCSELESAILREQLAVSITLREAMIAAGGER